MVMRFKGFAAALSAAVFVAGTGAAAAADLYAPTPAPVIEGAAPIINWTGFYAGIHGGGGWGDSQSTFLTGDPSPADFNLRGPYVGVQAGYNWHTASGFVLGVEGDISWSGIHGTRYAPIPDITTNHDIDWLGTVRGRLGYAMGSWMPYVTGGWAFAHANRFSSSVGETVAANHSGWTAGAGVEWQFAQNWSLKGEYKYIDLGPADYNFSSNPASVDIALHTFNVGLNYRF